MKSGYVTKNTINKKIYSKKYATSKNKIKEKGKREVWLCNLEIERLIINFFSKAIFMFNIIYLYLISFSIFYYYFFQFPMKI